MVRPIGFLLLAALMASAACAKPAAYPAAEVLTEFKATCSSVSDIPALRDRALKRGWDETPPSGDSAVGKMLAEMRSSPGKLILGQTYQPLFVLHRAIAGRTLWLVLSDMHIPDSERLQRQRSCEIYDEAAPEISELEAKSFFGRSPNVNRSDFDSQLYWDPAVTSGASYTALVHCERLCPNVVGLKLEASLMDWTDGQHGY